MLVVSPRRNPLTACFFSVHLFLLRGRARCARLIFDVKLWCNLFTSCEVVLTVLVALVKISWPFQILRDYLYVICGGIIIFWQNIYLHCIETFCVFAFHSPTFIDTCERILSYNRTLLLQDASYPKTKTAAKNCKRGQPAGDCCSRRRSATARGRRRRSETTETRKTEEICTTGHFEE